MHILYDWCAPTSESGIKKHSALTYTPPHTRMHAFFFSNKFSQAADIKYFLHSDSPTLFLRLGFLVSLFCFSFPFYTLFIYIFYIQTTRKLLFSTFKL
ncbi:hypothetical protein BCR42DRAFT_140653 [Absidia repens]|uniref:Uncharacterized protein n=1 Tax=Absidia repens TaxID=90262 RepID=A0A1X2I3F7_9FUNG|nr:hypothetical protein BCR42DRAFT_140653 [Absidia repens]